MSNNDSLVEILKEKAVLADERTEEAFRAVDRIDFVVGPNTENVYEDVPLPIGFGQTISQPYTVAFLLGLLGVKAGQRILDIGYGSGWQTALLAYLVGEDGQVVAIERIEGLCELGKNNIAKYPDLAARIILECHDAVMGPDRWQEGSFDGVIAAAEVAIVPPAWRNLLRPLGRLVYPMRGSIVLEIKEPTGDFEKFTYPGFAFVPFVTNTGSFA